MRVAWLATAVMTLGVTGCGVQGLEGEVLDESELFDGDELESHELGTLDQDVSSAWGCSGCQKCFDLSDYGTALPCMKWTANPPTGRIRIETGANSWNSIKLQRCNQAKWVDCSFRTVRQTKNYARTSDSIRISPKGPSWWRLCVQRYPGTGFTCSGSSYGKFFQGE